MVAKITPLHSSLGNKSETPSQKKIKKEKISIIKIAKLPKEIYKSNAISIKLPTTFLSLCSKLTNNFSSFRIRNKGTEISSIPVHQQYPSQKPN